MGTCQGIPPVRVAERLNVVDEVRWQQVDRIFEAALDCPTAVRPAFLTRECAGDRELLAEVKRLLAAHDRQDSFLERSGPVDDARLLADREGSTLVGETLGNYQIVRRLGIGGMGEVYLAQDMRLARPVAIKLLAPHWAADNEQVRRFRREALAASALNHPNILTIYEIGEWQGRDFIATEFVEGVTLREYKRDAPLPVAVSLDIALQIAGALAAAHHAGIVHRDIKPDNVMVRPDALVKVVDFGIAKHAEPRGAAVSDTASGLVMGTAAYMSPEQARGQEVDARTDIWSLGVVLYEMIGGRLPFAGATSADRIVAILEREPEPLGKVRRDVPATLETMVNRTLAKNRDERYGNADALAQDLRELRAELDEPRRQPFPSHTRVVFGAVALLLGIAAAVLAALGYFRPAVHSQRQAETGLARETIGSLAVLPFVNAGGTADTEYLADGITDTLINDLSEIPQLKVMSRSSVFRYKGQKVDAPKVGETLHVRAVLAGRVVQRADDLLVSVELVDALDNSHIWGEHYQRKLVNMFDLEQAIAREITEKLRLRLSKEERDRLARPHTNNPEAYQLYLMGMFYWAKRAPERAPEEFNKSLSYFQRAVEADPGYALAYAGLDYYYGFSSGNGFMDPEEGWPKAEAATRKALELDPTLVEARHGLAGIQWQYHRDWAAADREFRSAVQLNPNYAEAHNHYASFLAAKGRFDEAEAETRRALKLDPLSVRYISGLGKNYYSERRYDESIRQYLQALELDPNNARVHGDLGDVYQRAGREREAVAEWRASLTLAGDAALANMLTDSYARGGFAAALHTLARQKLERYAARKKRGEFVPAMYYANAYIDLGQKEQALRWLAKACDERNRFALFINIDPFYDELRGDPRFQNLVKRVAPN
jgi:serine/threonine protein kinase/Flp pilus assembly protein TadD